MKDNGPVNMQRKQEKTQTIIDRPQISFLTNSEQKKRKRERDVVITVYRKADSPLAARRLSRDAIIRFAEL